MVFAQMDVSIPKKKSFMFLLCIVYKFQHVLVFAGVSLLAFVCVTGKVLKNLWAGGLIK